MDPVEIWTTAGAFTERQKRRAVAVPTVLVVDDDPAFRELLSEFLRDAGYVVRQASDGLEASEIANESVESIDLVIVDLYMPQMSGLELAEQIREVSLTLPVVTMSAFPGPKFYRKSVELGCIAAFAKPFSFFQFLEYIDSLFDR